MRDYEALEIIKKNGICAIVRGTSPESLLKIAEALYEGGVRAIEVTFNTPGAEEMIKTLVHEYGDKMLIGAGTVLDSETARTAILAGASFILSPTLNLEMVKICHRYSVLAVPGIATPTEAMTAWENGVLVVKVFPAGVYGPDFLKQIRGPLPQLELMAVGGVGAENLGSFLKAGACSAGIGGELVNSKLAEAGNFEEIKKRAEKFTAIVKENRA